MATLRLVERVEAGRLLGSRFSALPMRDRIEQLLQQSDTVTIDFAKSNPTQSFVDELIGAMIMDHGAPILGRLVFANCSEDAKAILHFVISDRLDDLKRRLRDAN